MLRNTYVCHETIKSSKGMMINTEFKMVFDLPWRRARVVARRIHDGFNVLEILHFLT